MTYNDLWQYSKEKFNIDDQSIKYMFKYYLNLDDMDAINNINIDKQKTDEYIEKLKELDRGVPVQYVVGNVDFYGYNFKIKPGVLIPRFETEQLVYYTKLCIEKYFKDDISLIDIGTGSGIIGLTLKKEIVNLKVTMTDISDEALEVANDNAKLLDEDALIYKSDMLDEVIRRGNKYDVLVSNLPYLREDEEIMSSVREYEPSIALYGGKDGLKYYETLLKDAKKILKEKALIAFEIGEHQAKDIIAIANRYFKAATYEIKQDLTGRDRMFFLFHNLVD